MKRREEMNFRERIYLFEVLRGIGVTFGKLVKNLSLHVLHAAGFQKQKRAAATFQYPNERRIYPERFRGRHRLTLRENGDIKCTSCFLCATACPARCIFIKAAEHPDPGVEKFPDRYEIDTLLCIYCGYCVEACPVDAIRMDTGIHPEVYAPDPRLFIEDKELLMERSRIFDDLGRDALFEAHMKKMQRIESHAA